MAQRASAVVLLGSALVSRACLRGNGERPAAAADRVEPVVLAPAEIRAGGALPVAAVFPTIGRYAVSGLQSLQGAHLAVEDLNRAGGVHGRPLRLAEYRTGSYFVDARQAAALAARDGALAIVGANSSELSARGGRGGRGERQCCRSRTSPPPPTSPGTRRPAAAVPSSSACAPRTT